METRGKNRKGARVPRGTSPVGVTKVRFTVALWNKWLSDMNGEVNGKPDARIDERIKGIEEFRALCNESVAHGSDRDHDASKQEA